MANIKKNIESYAFGVCSYLGDKFGIRSSTIRLYFIYVSFFTFGSPIIIYFILAFWLNIKHYLVSRKHSVWDL
ncbi:MAG TPA: PspC family transcriptional regulator [Bacteroidetes bacterium]|nr:PspC family transcriptional regulator [Bacteroidota bacterium]